MNTIHKKMSKNGINKELNKVNTLEEFYAGNGILVTGGTGFVGIGLLEKLIRVCPRVAAIFVLIRPKTNETIEQRFKKIIDDPIYDGVKAKHPSALSRVYPMKGDVSLPDLGLSREDRNLLLEKVNIVLHAAATVRFDEPLHVAVNVNTNGTARVIELWNELRHPISFVHVSTAFSNANLHEIGEKVYTTSLKPSEVIDMCNKFDKTSINQIEKRILKTYPNTYTFSKNLAEQIVASKCKDQPFAIVRPSIIGASLEEPCPGWIENISALTSVMVLIMRGSVTIIRGRKDARLDVVPVDLVVDTIICAAWHVTLHREREVKVYNCTSNACPLTLMKLLKVGNKLFTSVTHFTMNEWTFQRDNCSDLARKVKMLSDSDMVKLDIRDIDWEKYVTIYVMGIRKFILKQKFKSTARQRLLRLYWIHQITKIFGIIILLWIILYLVY
ncbi:putative fatty acyl-CoA reductase CG5065 isoform X3 [Bombus affinis]|uniref:putative fatty acyl-CoA reductase CG5065 isoform X3 n=1 Tax=Bombus affinis TaxID=309941 RepID=UPI0021B7A38B|nr:putative fatty acyl-CoA reductase CG5065 isoform X3 [Bombus affinis]